MNCFKIKLSKLLCIGIFTISTTAPSNNTTTTANNTSNNTNSINNSKIQQSFLSSLKHASNKQTAQLINNLKMNYSKDVALDTLTKAYMNKMEKSNYLASSSSLIESFIMASSTVSQPVSKLNVNMARSIVVSDGSIIAASEPPISSTTSGSKKSTKNVNIIRNESLKLANLIRPRNSNLDQKRKLFRRETNSFDKMSSNSVKALNDTLTFRRYAAETIPTLLKKYSVT